MRAKSQLFFIPFIALIGLIIIYSLLHWILFIEFKIFSLKEVITCFLIPCILTIIVVLFYIRRKLKALNLYTKFYDFKQLYLLIVLFIIAIPFCTSQYYLVSDAGELTILNSINDVDQQASTKYYTLENYYIHKKGFKAHRQFTRQNKGGRSREKKLVMTIYFVIPILEKQSDTANRKCLGWLGVDYTKDLADTNDPKEREVLMKKFREFEFEIIKDFTRRNLSNFIHLERIGYSSLSVGYQTAINKSRFYDQNQNIFIRFNTPYEERNVFKQKLFFYSIVIGAFIWFIMILIPKLKNDPNKNLGENREDILE